MCVVSFSQRVCDAIIQGAIDYKKTFLDYEYLIYSGNFVKQPYYIINALVTNYLHLTGVNTTLSTYDFFNASVNKTLTTSDFSFNKPSRSKTSAKGSIRRKIQALTIMPKLFSNKLIAEEAYKRNTVICSLATTDTKITMGFVNDVDAKPKTLLYGNELNTNNAIDISLILRRKKISTQFDTIVQGDPREFCSRFPDILLCNLEQCKKNHIT